MLFSRDVVDLGGTPVNSLSIDTAVCNTGRSLLEMVDEDAAVDVDALECAVASFELESLLLPNLVEAGRSFAFSFEELGRLAADGGTASTD